MSSFSGCARVSSTVSACSEPVMGCSHRAHRTCLSLTRCTSARLDSCRGWCRRRPWPRKPLLQQRQVGAERHQLTAESRALPARAVLRSRTRRAGGRARARPFPGHVVGIHVPHRLARGRSLQVQAESLRLLGTEGPHERPRVFLERLDDRRVFDPRRGVEGALNRPLKPERGGAGEPKVSVAPGKRGDPRRAAPRW
jgi:hypothetical protein